MSGNLGGLLRAGKRRLAVAADWFPGRGLTWVRRGLLLLLLVAGLLYVRAHQDEVFSWPRLVQHEQWLRQSIEQHPLVSFGVGLVVYTLVALIPGSTGKAILFGWLFGFWPGLAIVSVALTIAATLSFSLARYLLRDFVQRRLGIVVRQIDRSFERRGAEYLVTLRVLHVPYSLLNYAVGATGVSATTFAWTTLLGMFPGNVAFVLAGSQLPTLEGVFDAGMWSLIDLRVLAALSAAILIPVLARQVAIRLRARREASLDGTTAGVAADSAGGWSRRRSSER